METEIHFEPFERAERLPSMLPWAVYRATDGKTGHVVRLSVLWPAEHLSPERVRASLDWFAEAGYQAQRLTSPALASVLSYRSAADFAYVATGFPAGQTLRDMISAEGAIPVARAMHISSLLARTLAQAHAVGWAHGWLNGETVWISEGDLVTVADLGLGLAAPSATANAMPFPARPGFFSNDPMRRDMQCLGLLVTQMLTGTLPDPVGVPRAGVFPVEVPGGVVRQVRGLVNPQDEEAMTAAEWADFARVTGKGAPEPIAVPEDEPDHDYYEEPSPVRRRIVASPADWMPYAWGAGAVVVVAAAVFAGMHMRNGASAAPERARPSVTAPVVTPAPTSSAAPATPAPAPDTLTRVQVGPIEPGQADAVAERLRGMGFDPYIRREEGRVFIQVGAFANAAGAQATQEQLKRAGLPVRVQ